MGDECCGMRTTKKQNQEQKTYHRSPKVHNQPQDTSQTNQLTC
jgi:hypothetical protein